MTTQSAYERRVSLALKWHHLENLDNEAIRQRFIDEGYGKFARQTISGYLNSKPAEEVMEQIHANQAHVREQSAERWERKHERSRQAEREATEDHYVKAVRPSSERNTADHPIHVQNWRVLEGDERPDHAGPEDVFIERAEGTTLIDSGVSYYVLDPEGNPEYTTVLVGVERDQPDLARQQSLRTEQASHQREKATVLGAYEERHHHTVEGAVAVGELSEEQAATFEELTGAPGGGESTDSGEGGAE